MFETQQLTFRWWNFLKNLSPHVLLGETKLCGIYILEFETGERYVGQARNIASRITQHMHGAGHHSAWQDIKRIGCCEISPEKLSVTEKAVIADQLRRGYSLRNVIHNMKPSGARPFDLIISHEDQRHWAAGDESYLVDIGTLSGLEDVAPSKLERLPAARRPSYFGNSLFDAVLDDLAMAVIHFIPNAMQLEGEYWSISDAPNTLGGRFATLNVGNLEIMYFPRFEIDMSTNENKSSYYPSILNGEYVPELEPLENDDFWVIDDPNFSSDFVAGLTKGCYPMSSTRQVILPTGALKRLSTETREWIFSETRSLVLQLMRRGRNTLFNRYHSKALTTAVYRRAHDILGEQRALSL